MKSAALDPQEVAWLLDPERERQRAVRAADQAAIVAALSAVLQVTPAEVAAAVRLAEPARFALLTVSVHSESPLPGPLLCAAEWHGPLTALLGLRHLHFCETDETGRRDERIRFWKNEPDRD